jgi:opacity protein-like surface antigen
MKKLLIVLLLAVLAPANVHAHGGGWNGHYHYGYHGAYYGGAGFFLFGAALGAALTYSYSQARANPDPYYYYSPGPPVYMQSQQPRYVMAPADQGVASTQRQYGGVTELGPVNSAPEVQSNTPALPADRWFVYPGKGQSQQQAANDRHDCDRWATSQSGYDPDLRVHRNPQTGSADYGRALSACLEGRGYTVR